MIAGATTVLSYACLIDFPPLISSLHFSNRPPLRFYSPRPSRVFHQHRNSVPRRLITRVAESITDGFWEEPDDGFGSEGDESEDEEIGKEQTATSYSGDSNARHSKCDYEQLVKEVEQLLEQEERDILQQNEVPDISKISTKKWSLFHSLGLSLQIPLMDELLERGWDIDSIDKDGYTALHKAVIGKKEAVISHLLRKGANPFIRDRGGATALHYAVQAGAMQTVKLLIKYKVDVNAADNDGWTPLHISMQSRSRDIAKVLLVNGADKTRRNKRMLIQIIGAGTYLVKLIRMTRHLWISAYAMGGTSSLTIWQSCSNLFLQTETPKGTSEYFLISSFVYHPAKMASFQKLVR